MLSELTERQVKFNRFLQERFHQTKRSRESFSTSVKVSIEELEDGLIKFRREKNLTEFSFLIKDIIGNSAWIGSSLFKLIKSSVTPHPQKGNIYDVYSQMIVKAVALGAKLDLKKYHYNDIFKAIHNEIEFAHYNPQYKTPLVCPKINCTIVLVSGVLNEIYKTAAFERGANHLKQVLGVEYMVANVHGRKGAKYNSKLLYKELSAYTEKNPDKKLWILAYSKGGIDILHFCKDHHGFAKDKILGVSTIASPIMGTRHIDEHKLLKMVQVINRYSHTKLYRSIDKKRDLLARECQKSLAASYRENWFKKNREKLPTNLFYTALPLESSFFQGHLATMLVRMAFPQSTKSDGMVDVDRALFPDNFGMNLGPIRGHHMVGARSSSFRQEALIEAHIIFLHYLGLLH